MPSSSSSIYSYRPGGSLKFKGGESLPMKKKKKSKSKSKSSTSKDIRTKDDYRSSSKDKDIGTLSKHGEDDDVEEEQLKSGKIMTEAEKKFEEIKRKRMADRVAKEAGLSHKDRVDQFNKSLAERTEHNDMLTVAGH
ncbi:hypothetical protein L7F22_019593 [Adiantum nelumboides]|nr:hypothetical protein [Adiantum nelumboides]